MGRGLIRTPGDENEDRKRGMGDSGGRLEGGKREQNKGGRVFKNEMV